MALRIGRATSGLLVFMLLCTSPVSAQRTTFNPVISLDYLYSDNVQYVGDASDVADSGVRLGLQLPLVRTMRKGSVSLTYSPRLDQYDKFEELDNTGHNLVFDFALSPTPISRFSISAALSRDQDQGDPAAPDGEVFIGRRTERQRASFDLDYRNRLSGRFLWGFSTRFADWSFKEIEGFDPGAANPIGDRTTTQGAVDFLRILSRTTNLGVRLGYGRYKLDQGGEDESRDVGLVLEHAISESSSFQIGLGAFENEGDAAVGQQDQEVRSQTGVQGFIAVTKEFRKANLAVNGQRSPSSGGTLEGTSTDSSLAFSVGGGAGRRWNWSIDTRFARREPNNEQLDTIDTVALGLGLGFRMSRRLELRLSPLYTRQVGNDMGVDSLVLRGGFGLAWSWAPLEKTRLGGGG